MNISKYTVEDFVLDKEFRVWVLSPNTASNIIWDKLLIENPSQFNNVKIAREILLNLTIEKDSMTEIEFKKIWEVIDRETENYGYKEIMGNVVPLNSGSTLKRLERQPKEVYRINQVHRVVAILVMAFGLSIIMNLMYPTPHVVLEVPLLVYEEHRTTPGVKSTLTLQDGSKVILNSGSTLRYLKNFESDKRILYLNGEAYFEVMRDSLRPFSVITGDVVTTALGTSFNISAYHNEELDIALVTGKVTIDTPIKTTNSVWLEKGEGLRVNLESGKSSKSKFDQDQKIGWTQKKIVLEKVRLTEATRIIENWYGVKFIFKNTPDPALLLSGIFQDETLENVLQGLSYSARFDFIIKDGLVNIKFK